jgi:hydrogenase expression/formation protein HypD
MKYVDEFRDAAVARALARRIATEAQPGRRYAFMEFCGGHTHALARYGIPSLLPPALRMIHGPGCPVCVLPVGRIDQAIALALTHRAIVCTYGDTLRVPASDGLSLTRARARGGDVRVVCSASDALALARAHPDRQVVLFAIGFETTTPPTALAVLQAEREGLANFSVLACHVLTPAAITHLLSAAEAQAIGTVPIDGFIGPAHVSVVIGSEPYAPFAQAYRKPVVIAGFEPLDVLQAILMLVRQVNDGRAEVENQFTRAVTPCGNRAAQSVVAEVFEPRESFEWRGLGEVPASALRLRPRFARFDAEQRFALPYRPVPDHRQCECGAILRGVRQPADCKLFATVCTPENPMGSCMVSSEGACAAHYAYGRFAATPDDEPRRRSPEELAS